jgi:hypothetical protein
MVSADSIMRRFRGLKSGDTLRVEVEHASSRRTATVVMTPFDRPVVRLVDVAGATPAQRALRERWETGLPLERLTPSASGTGGGHALDGRLEHGRLRDE